jgi:hypothetical protein
MQVVSFNETSTTTGTELLLEFCDNEKKYSINKMQLFMSRLNKIGCVYIPLKGEQIRELLYKICILRSIYKYYELFLKKQSTI